MYDDQDEMDLIADLQAAHSTNIAKRHYGRTGTGLDARSRRDFRENSDLWAHFLELRVCIPESEYQSRTSTPKPSTQELESKVEDAMSYLFGVNWTWKLPEQKESIRVIAKGDPYVISVLPTDAGKTTLILVRALINPHLTQIVITPYVALGNDLKSKCDRKYIDCIQWTPTTRTRASIVVVVVDTAITAKFRTYLRDLDLQNKLGDIFVDEAHVYLTETSWRWAITGILDLSLPVPFRFLTATFPPSLQEMFEHKFTLDNSKPTYVRSSCIRHKIQYSVESVANHIPLEERAVELIQYEKARLQEGQKILVFGPAKEPLKHLAHALECGVYAGNEVEKDEVLDNWKRGICSTLCATSALGAGIDIEDIVLVIHVGYMYDIFTFQQGAGRGGRGGKESRSITLMSEGSLKKGRKGEALGKKCIGDKELVLYLTTEICRQQVLNQFFNGKNDVSTCEGLECTLCDLCQKRKDDIEKVTKSVKRRASVSINPDHQRLKRAITMQREEEIEERLRIEAVLEEKVKKQIARLQTDCPYCWTFIGSYHKLIDCDMPMGFGLPHISLSDMQQKRELPANHGCFQCGVPCDWCESYVSLDGGGCNKLNVIWPIVDHVLQKEGWSEEVREWSDGVSLSRNRERVMWMRKERMVFGKKSTNAFYVFVKVCEKFC
jgi:superfamily II DNA helicase RecQ